MELQSRFWSKVKTVDSGCMEWQRSLLRTKFGYGSFTLKNKEEMAHRVALLLSGVYVKRGMHVMHKCDNTKCVNPLHLSIGTHTDNIRDMVAKKRDVNSKKTHCSRGHEFSGLNLFVNERGHRKCRQCSRDAVKEYRKKKMAAQQ